METLTTHCRYYGNEEGDGYEIYYCDFPDIRGFGDTYGEALADAAYHLKAGLARLVAKGAGMNGGNVKATMTALIGAAHEGDRWAQGVITYCSNASIADSVNVSFRSLESEEQEAFVRQIVQSRIIPPLAHDGGSIELVNFIAGETPQIWLKYGGHCSGCHLSSTTTAQMILDILEEAIDRKIVVYLW